MTSLSRLSMFYSEFGAPTLLRAMIREEFKDRIALISSFGADAALLLSMVAEVDQNTPILFLETDKHFPETISYALELTKLLGLKNLHFLRPDPALTARIDPNGDLWNHTPNRCCWLRKIEPLDRAVKELGIAALITGRKRYQTKERAQLEKIELDEKGIFRINPLVYYSREKQRDEMQARGLPEHPLIEKKYLSIGCAPCTKPVAQGEDERAGRWAHTIGIDEEQKTECGIHLPSSESGNWSV